MLIAKKRDVRESPEYRGWARWDGSGFTHRHDRVRFPDPLP